MTIFAPHVHIDFLWCPWIYTEKGKLNIKFFKQHSFAEVKNRRYFFQGKNKSIPMEEALV